MIYLDNASTTPINEEIQELILKTMKKFGNPSNNYSLGHETKQLIEHAREQVASALGATPEEIYFTSGASESNSMAIAQKKFCWASPYEHHSILYNPKVYIKNNLKEEILNQDNERIFNDLLISHMLVNNETGEIFDITELANLCEKKSILFHTDATQAVGKIEINVKKEKVKMLSLSGHKFNAPKGIGVIFIDKSIKATPFIIGGGQEKGLRGGTENVPYIVALGEAIEKATDKIHQSYLYYQNLKEIFIKKLNQYNNIDWRINSPCQNSTPSIINIAFKGIEGEIMAAMLAEKQIFVGTGSACNTGDFKPSHVLEAMNVPKEYINGAIRISFGKQNTAEEVEKIIKEIVNIYKELIY